MLCLSEIQSPNALRTSNFRQVCGALLVSSWPVIEPQRHRFNSLIRLLGDFPSLGYVIAQSAQGPPFEIIVYDRNSSWQIGNM